MKVRINRKKWLRGGKNPNGNYNPSVLWDNTNKAGCCLGHAVRQEKHCSWGKLTNKSYPKDIVKILGKTQFTKFQQKAVRINDNIHMDEAGRERKLIKLFAKYGHELEFYG